jgi:hypothetical protein
MGMTMLIDHQQSSCGTLSHHSIPAMPRVLDKCQNTDETMTMHLPLNLLAGLKA